MIVVVPTLINDARLTSSTIPEPDTGEEVWAPYTSAIGDERISTVTHIVYRAAFVSTDDPVDGVNANPPTWVNVRPTNKHAMFDGTNSTKSEEDTQLIVELTPGFVNNSISGFAIEAVNLINVIVTDPVAGEVYNEDVDMSDNSKIVDWYAYFNEPIVKRTEFILLDLPAYTSATIKLTADGGDIRFGNLIIGSQLDLGITNVGSNLNLVDYSRYEVDDFGNTVITPGRTSKLVEFDLTIQEGDSSRIFNTVDSLTGIPSVWVGTTDVADATLVFGYYRDFKINLSHIIQSATLTIQGLV